MPQPDSHFFDDFFEDYLAECDEHLGTIRVQLLSLEPQIDQSSFTAASLQPLFRALHSLKGLSGMVGVQGAETLAHALESYLRHLRDPEVTLTAAGFEALIHGVTVLDTVLRACQRQTEMPDLAPVLAEIGAVTAPLRSPLSPLLPTVISEAEEQQIQAAQERGDRLWIVIFTPSSALVEAGITVNRVRDRLSDPGTILAVTPQSSPTQGVTFRFIVAHPQADPPPHWQLAGVEVHPYAAPEPLDRGVEAPDLTAPPIETASSAAIAPTLVRVDLHKLDEVMEQVAELVMSRVQLSSQIQQLRGQVPTATWRQLNGISRTLEQQLRELRTGVLRVRLVPLTDTFKRLEFAARELARTMGKAVQVVVEGDGTELDKVLVDRMIDPLIHLVRNAVSHGIEPVAVRRDRAKPDRATLTLRASTAGERISLEIEEDGGGIDPAVIGARSQALHLAPPSSLTTDSLDPDLLLSVLCTPGFSTQDQPDLTSGRGVGMAIVRTTVQELGGHLSLRSTPGQGTCFRIELPLTLAITDALIVTVGDRTFAIPQATLRELFPLAPQDRPAPTAPALLPYRDGLLPLVTLHHRFHLPSPPPDRTLVVIVVAVGALTLGLLVDRVVSQSEIVVRPLQDPLVQGSGISGATALGDGKIILILDVASLIHQTLLAPSDRAPAP